MAEQGDTAKAALIPAASAAPDPDKSPTGLAVSSPPIRAFYTARPDVPPRCFHTSARIKGICEDRRVILRSSAVRKKGAGRKNRGCEMACRSPGGLGG
ncbi:hypothetical protein EVAR_34386_1 [Eumeta japonica]|uniref:Uncharacterized protein n=1 Tax=Eumeta variegata TaxID=151549 RepID=A0A4C1WY05_EUMVA|nr:hypothetical protein EVAR_34386_1 [Eumeta japonica]